MEVNLITKEDYLSSAIIPTEADDSDQRHFLERKYSITL